MCVTLSQPEIQVLVTCVCCIKSTRDTGHVCVTLSLSEGQVMYVMLNEVMTDRETNCCIFNLYTLDTCIYVHVQHLNTYTAVS